MTQHIQNFDVKGGPQIGQENLPKLRAALKSQGLDGFLVPHEDEYNNEYLPANAERLAWATGFTGSAGAAIVMAERAAVFVDGRYTEQVKAQVDNSLYEYRDLVEEGLHGWIAANAKSGEKIGYDPKLHAPDALSRIEKAAEKAGAKLVATETNPIDSAWENRPDAPAEQVHPHTIEFAGIDHGEKRDQIASALKAAGADAAVITDPASIAWLLNLRGGDVMCTPLPLSAVILNNDGHASLFINEAKLTDATRMHLGNEVSVRDEADFSKGLKALSGKTVSVDPAKSSAWVFQKLSDGGAQIHRAMDPVALPKAAKNATEIMGSQNAHIRDGAAIVRFLHWLDTEAQSGEFDEIHAAIQLETFRKQSSDLKDLSFETISAAGPNGAFPHYRVNTATTRKLEKGSLYLVDSGGQYPDGTTDITRTVPIGAPSEAMKRHFTLVLKGMIGLSMIRFPEGTTGHALDAIARAPLWAAGHDYDHGTGHGVGSYLGVHEGPQRIAKAANSIALKPGMIVSNEPGYYLVGSYGIRIENLQFVTAPQAIEHGDRNMLGFQYLTVAPIHRGLIDASLMSEGELSWLNAYHGDVLAKVGPLVDGDVSDWLINACAAI